MDELLVSFDGIEDPRINRTKQFSVSEIMFLVLTAVLSGVRSWRGVEDFGEDRIDWLRNYLPYENGIPSHQTIGRVMSLIKPSATAKAFIQFMSTLYDCDENNVVALDGKTLRRSFDKAAGQKPLHILNAWAVDSGLSLGQLGVEEKTNEITAVPDILDLIDLRHATVVADALNTQKTIAEKIVSMKSDYVLPVKGNHKNLEEEIELAFSTQPVDVSDPSAFKETTEKGHGRVETRKYTLLPCDLISQCSEWAGIKAIGKVENEFFRDGKTTKESRIYILSFSDISRFSKVVRGYWGIENSLHWVLDVSFREDDCRIRKDHAPENFSTIRKLALNLLNSEKTTKLSVPRKMAKASRKTEYLDKILNIKGN